MKRYSTPSIQTLYSIGLDPLRENVFRKHSGGSFHENAIESAQIEWLNETPQTSLPKSPAVTQVLRWLPYAYLEYRQWHISVFSLTRQSLQPSMKSEDTVKYRYAPRTSTRRRTYHTSTYCHNLTQLILLSAETTSQTHSNNILNSQWFRKCVICFEDIIVFSKHFKFIVMIKVKITTPSKVGSLKIMQRDLENPKMNTISRDRNEW